MRDIKLKGGISHAEGWGPSFKYFVERSFYIEDVLYTVSKVKVKMNNLNDLQLIKELKLHLES